jgi:hypothetical protein
MSMTTRILSLYTPQALLKPLDRFGVVLIGSVSWAIASPLFPRPDDFCSTEGILEDRLVRAIAWLVMRRVRTKRRFFFLSVLRSCSSKCRRM